MLTLRLPTSSATLVAVGPLEHCLAVRSASFAAWSAAQTAVGAVERFVPATPRLMPNRRMRPIPHAVLAMLRPTPRRRHPLR
eukprot:7379751-Prymnesium_polylepis.1